MPPNYDMAETDSCRERADGPRVGCRKLNGYPGRLLTGRARELCRTWPNETEVTVQEIHLIQEDSPDEVGEVTAAFTGRLLIKSSLRAL